MAAVVEDVRAAPGFDAPASTPHTFDAPSPGRTLGLTGAHGRPWPSTPGRGEPMPNSWLRCRASLCMYATYVRGKVGHCQV